MTSSTATPAVNLEALGEEDHDQQRPGSGLSVGRQLPVGLPGGLEELDLFQ